MVKPGEGSKGAGARDTFTDSVVGRSGEESKDGHETHSPVGSVASRSGEESEGSDDVESKRSVQMIGLPDDGLIQRAKSPATRFKRGEGRNHRAILRAREALRLRPSGHPMQSVFLASLATHLRDRYNELGAMEDLNEAIRLDQEALVLRPPGHPDRSASLNNIAVGLRARYRKLGAMNDLNEAIRLNQEALALRPRWHPDHSASLNNIAVGLWARYQELGAMDDLNEAIRLHQEALVLHPRGHPNRSLSLVNLAVILQRRYKNLGATDDLDKVIRLSQEALVLRPPGHPLRSSSLNSLASGLRARYKKLGAMDDLNEAIRLDQDALVLRPPGHPDRSASLNNLALDLRARYKQLGAMDDLNEAIRLHQEVLVLRPPGHPRRSFSLDNLAVDLSTRYRKLGAVDKEEIFAVYAQLADISQIVSFDDISAAEAWIRHAHEFQHPTTTLAYETYLRFLVRHLTALPSLPQHLHLVKAHTSSFAMDAFSVSLCAHSPTKAVELLEQGRGVFWGQLTRLRSPVDNVITSGQEGKSLGEQFAHLTSLIRNAIHSPRADQHDRVCRLNFELQTVVDNIRQLPGFSRFLLPPLFSDLQQAASEGPVIIVNTSKYSCDALVVLLDRDPVHIPLHVTIDRARVLSSTVYALSVRAKRMEVGKEFAGVLRQIWDEIVSPIVDILQKIQPLYSRIWWCPTAEFYLLPLHAAGPYRKGQPKLADLYISSYTPSLSALIRARQQKSLNLAGQRRRFLAMGQATAVGESELVSIGTELASIGQRIGDAASFTSIEGAESCISRVNEELSKNEWVHFACHGIPNREQPFKSAFALHDGRLTVQDVMHYELKNAEFAYLSACHTMVGDSQSPDEMIHLASAMHFAGFRSVIGTMWAVDDKQATRITSMFYDNMIGGSSQLDYARAAYALHKTMKEVERVTLDQRILYVHIGA